MSEGKSKCTKCDFYKENTFTPAGTTVPVTQYSFNVEFESGIKGTYQSKSKDNPKFKVGEESEFTYEEKLSKTGTKFNVIKPKQEPFAKGGAFKQKPTHLFCLELARKMYNSSQETPKPITEDQMLAIADLLIKKVNSGISRDAIETATTIQCAEGVRKVSLNSETMITHIKLIDAWIKKNAQVG